VLFRSRLNEKKYCATENQSNFFNLFQARNQTEVTTKIIKSI
jgi:hypothetical protein